MSKSDDTAAGAATASASAHNSRPSHYVGIGASAGGLEAIENFFKNIPRDCNLGFIVIQHLSPDYKSLMVELLSKKTPLKVVRAEEGMQVEANCVYLIPPKHNMTIFHGKLLLKEYSQHTGINLPIDIFFRSLAEDQAERAVAVVLSGTGSDGTRGVRAIKEHNGMVMVQSGQSAKFDGMPKAAISTGVADFVESPDELAKRLLHWAAHPGKPMSPGDGAILSNEDNLDRIFAMLRERADVDFTYYKPTTILRRLERRMTICHVSTIEDYINYLYRTPSEVMTLYNELLIGVTSFFRDPEVMATLRKEFLPAILSLPKSQEIRLWVAGCSTGEEAYTLAILIREAMEALKVSHDIKIFATDIDKDALVKAGAGTYPESIAADLTPQLLAKYFTKNGDMYQIARNIRSMVVFARHNLIKDPPFTNISLVSCRNLLIYLQPSMQHRAIQMFNYALRPGGILLLGLSETIGDNASFFRGIQPKQKIYESIGRQGPGPHSLMQDTGKNMQASNLSERNHFLSARRPNPFSDEEKIVARLLDTLAESAISPVAVVNTQKEMVYAIGALSPYLQIPAGKTVFDIGKMAARELSVPITTGVQKVFRTNEPINYTNVRLSVNGESQTVSVQIFPIKGRSNQEPLAAVQIDSAASETPRNAETQVFDVSEQTQQRIRDLESELQFSKENLQATIEELETSNEELQATNEELLASNEELQSTNEELQSTNEELYTVNAEYQNKINELTEVNNDVDNLLTSSGIGKLLLDENLVIRKFSPEITNIFQLLETDVGRPIYHLAHHLVDTQPVETFRQVRDTDTSVELFVKTKDEKKYLMRVLPFRIGPREFSGILASFVDVTELHQIRADIVDIRAKAKTDGDRQEARYRRLFDTIDQGVVYQNATGEIVDVNCAALEILGVSEDQIKGRTSMDERWRTVYPDGSPLDGKDHPAMVSLRTNEPVKDFVMGVFNPRREQLRWIRVTATPFFRPNEENAFEVYAVFSDITDSFQPPTNP